MQGHNMAILSQAEMKISGVCRDYTGATHKGDERVQAISKDLDSLFRFVYRVDGRDMAAYISDDVTKQPPKRGNLNSEMNMAIPCQAAAMPWACVETIQRPAYLS